MSSIAENDFKSQLYLIQSQNPPSLVLFPETKTIYDIDLDSRTITGPEILSVSRDHKAETVYFRIDRFRDYMDLSKTKSCCYIFIFFIRNFSLSHFDSMVY